MTYEYQKTTMNKPTRLRMICYRHLKNTNPNVGSDKIDALEQDIKTFVKAVIHNAQELGLQVKTEEFIGDLN